MQQTKLNQELCREDKAKMVWQFFSPGGRADHFTQEWQTEEEAEKFIAKDFDELDGHEKNIVADTVAFLRLFTTLSEQEDWKEFFQN